LKNYFIDSHIIFVYFSISDRHPKPINLSKKTSERSEKVIGWLLKKSFPEE